MVERVQVMCETGSFALYAATVPLEHVHEFYRHRFRHQLRSCRSVVLTEDIAFIVRSCVLRFEV